MRVTLDPHGDVLLPTGRTLAELRPALAHLTGRAAWRTAPVHLGGRPLADDHVAGVPPWLAGTVLEVGDGPPRTSPSATHAGPAAAPESAPDDPWRLVVVDGPDAGTVAAVGARAEVMIGRRSDPGASSAGLGQRARGRLDRGRRRPAAPAHPAPTSPRRRARAGAVTLALDDPLVSREHAVVRRGRNGWSVRDLRSANGSTLVTGPARRRSGRPLPVHTLLARPARPGDALRLGSTVMLLDGPPPPASRVRVVLRALRHPSVLVALAGAAVVAALTRNAMFLAFGLLGPVSALAARLGAGSAAGDAPAPPGHDGWDAAADTSTDTAADEVGDPVGALPVVAGRPVLVDAGQARRPHADRPGLPAWWPLAREGLAITGPGAAGVVRALVLGALADPAARLTALLGEPGWEWLRWADGPLTDRSGHRVARTAAEAEAVLAEVPEAPVLVLDVAGSVWRPQVHRWFGRRRPGDAVLVSLAPGEEPPTWCRWTLVVGPDGSVLSGPAGRRTVIAPPVPATVAEAVARSRAPGWTTARTGLPDRVGWADLGLPVTADDVLGAWELGTDAVTARLGIGPSGRPVDVELRRDGPHALVAGTTGAGKSELLQTLLLSLATTRPPHELAVVLVDYKGGAGFGECARLPHVVGVVTDLDAASSARALAALRTELRRREEHLAAAGATDLDGLRRSAQDAPPRLLVLVDEFRALVEDLPDFVPGLVRIATQGRSLGVHLVLATQRPAGVVDAQLRANLPLRVCLRVADRADSVDVVEVPDAAAIPADRPGRALVHRAGGRPEPVQTAWAALPTGTADGVRWAPAWSIVGPHPARSLDDPDTDAVARLVDAVREAHRRTGRAAPEAPWLPPLPTLVGDDELCPASDGALPLALADRPELRLRQTVAWEPSEGALLVVGGPSSGRTTALRTVAHAALRSGRHVHVVSSGERAAWLGTAAGGGTVVGPEDPARLARLLDRLLDGVRHPTVLVVDDVVAVQQALALLPRGVGDGLLDRVVREGRGRGVAAALAGGPVEAVRYLPQAALRLVLPLADAHDATLFGAPTAPDGPPGRAVAIGPGRDAAVCQVATGGGPPEGSGRPGQPPSDRGGAGHVRPTVLMPLPGTVDAAPVGVLGLGGDDGGEVRVPAGSLLVVGPARSGRSTALARVVAAHRAVGREVVVLDDLDARLRSDPLLDERVASQVHAGHPSVVASARTDHVAAAYRGALAALRETAVLVLDPAQPGSSDVAGVDVALYVDPGRLPGRGVLVAEGTLTPVQVARR